LTCLAQSTPCIKNTASPNEGKKKKKGGKDKRCIRQEAWHHEVHYHVLPDDDFDMTNDKYKLYKIKKDKNKNDKDYKKVLEIKKKDKEDRDAVRNTTSAHTKDYSPALNKIDTVPKTNMATWKPRKPWRAFGTREKRDDHASEDVNKSVSVSVPTGDITTPSNHEKRYQLARGEVMDPKPYPFTMDEVVAIKEVNVTIEQNGKDPIAINVIIRNNSKMNVTVMTRNSVVDKDAFKLGYFRTYPDETRINFSPEREGFDWYHTPIGKLGRKMDSRRQFHAGDLTHLGPGEVVKQTIIIPSGNKEENDQWMKMMRHAKKIKMHVEGKWFAIGAWKDTPRWSRHVDFKFLSNTLDLEIPR
jgi:hypothetical protein